MTPAPSQGALVRFLRKPPPAVRAALFVAAMIAYSTAGFLFFEKPGKPELRWIDAVWWTIVTISTVGYGDYFPATTAGRLFIGIPTMLTGVGILSYALSQVGSYFTRAEAARRKGLSMQKVANHILVCNHPSRQRVTRLLRELRAHEELSAMPVVIVDEQLAELDEELMVEDVHFVRGHPARAETLNRAAATDAGRAVILARDARAPESDHLSVAICLSLKQLRPDLHVVAECVDAENMELLRRAGCESVVCIHELAPGILAQEVHEPGVVAVIEALTAGAVSANIYVVPVVLGGDRPHAVAELQAWSLSHGMLLLALRSAGEVLVNPPASRALHVGDAAVVVASSRPDGIVLAPASREVAAS
jgi:voltage-gated potassium channel